MKTTEEKVDKALYNKMAVPEINPPERLWDSISKKIGNEPPPFWKTIFRSNYFIAFSIVVVLGVSGLIIFNNLPETNQATQENTIASEALSGSQTPTQESRVQSSANRNPENKKDIPFNTSQSTDELQTQTEANANLSITANDKDDEFYDLNSSFVGIKNINGNYVITGLKDTTGFRITNKPKNGTVIFDQKTGKFKYKPNKGFYGSDSFGYQIIDEDGTISNQGTIKIKVEKETSCIANFDYQIASGTDVKFNNHSAAGNIDNAVSYLWQFGDGETSTEQNPQHRYTNGGAFEVCLSMTQGKLNDKICQTIMIDAQAFRTSRDDSGKSIVLNKTVSIDKNTTALINPEVRNSRGGQSLKRVLKKKDITTETSNVVKNKKKLLFGRGNLPDSTEEALALAEKKKQ